MSFYDKLQRFQNLIALNDRTVKSNTLHISLNFHRSEKYDKEKLKSIAKNYMEKIGFGAQPYLVYEHRDAGHPHIHIVTTNIQADGKRMDTYNIGKLKSEPARIEIEAEFNLVQATDKNRNDLESLVVEKPEYGKSETKRAITNVLDKVLKDYNFNSFTALNTILKTFNVEADKGKEGGRIQKYRGLLYHMLNREGKRGGGVPVKASSLYNKPIRDFLENLFEINKSNRSVLRYELQQSIEQGLSKSPRDIHEFIKGLKCLNIQTLLRTNDEGFLYGITFIEHNNKSVFNGSEVGKKYSVAALQKRFSQQEKAPANAEFKTKKSTSKATAFLKTSSGHGSDKLIQNLLASQHDDPRLLYPLLDKKKKKKRRPSL